MRTASALEVRAKFGQILDEAAAGEQIVVERAGVAIAAIVPLSTLEATDPETAHARRMAAVERLVQSGQRYGKLYGPFDATARIREDRDHGHSV